MRLSPFISIGCLLTCVTLFANLSAAATAPAVQVNRVWVAHDTHRSVEPWWERGTEWEGKPAMTVYAEIDTRGLGGRELNVEITFQNPDGSLVRWRQGAPSFCTGRDGVLRPAWMDRPPANGFRYSGFRIPVPYAAFDPITLTGDTLTVTVRAWSGAAQGAAQTQLPSAELAGRVIDSFAADALAFAGLGGDIFAGGAAGLRVTRVSVQPEHIAPGGRFDLVVEYSASDPASDAGELPVAFSYRILSGDTPLFSKPAVEVAGRNGQPTTLRKRGLVATTTPGRYTLEAVLEYAGHSASASTAFTVAAP